MNPSHIFALTVAAYVVGCLAVAFIHGSIIVGERASGAYGSPGFRSKTKSPVWIVIRAFFLLTVPFFALVTSRDFDPNVVVGGIVSALGVGGVIYRQSVNFFAKYPVDHVGTTKVYDSAFRGMAAFLGVDPWPLVTFFEALLSVAGVVLMVVAPFGTG